MARNEEEGGGVHKTETDRCPGPRVPLVNFSGFVPSLAISDIGPTLILLIV
jgi:hypothetical protein